MATDCVSVSIRPPGLPATFLLLAVVPGKLMETPLARGELLSVECLAVKRTGLLAPTVWLVGLGGWALLA